MGGARISARLGRLGGWLLLGAILAFMILPTIVVIMASFNPTAILSFPPEGLSLRWYGNALTYPQFQRAAWNSLWVTLGCVGLAVPVGGLAVLALERSRLRGREAIQALLLSPLIIPGVVGGLGLLFLGAAAEILQSRWLMVLAHVIVVLPFVMRSIWVSLRNLDPALELAAASLGADPVRTFLRVTLPLLRPGIVVAVIFTVVLSLNEFVVSLFISTRVTEILPVAMFTYIVNYTDPTIAAVSTLFIVGTTAVVVGADRWLRLVDMLQLGHR